MKHQLNHKKIVFCISLLLLLTTFLPAVQSSLSDQNKQIYSYFETLKNRGQTSKQPLPHYREGGTPYNPDQHDGPCEITYPSSFDKPTSGIIASPPEYDPSDGIILWYNTGQYPDVVSDLVVEITQPDQYDETVYCVVIDETQRSAAQSDFSSAGANMSKVEFIIQPGDSIWMRDYGPHFIWQNNTLQIVDSHYYPTRPLDNFIPTLLGDDNFDVFTHDMGLYYSGGNFQPGPDRSGFVTELVFVDNPGEEGFNKAFISELYHDYQGIDTLHIMEQLPPDVDGTGHIDMWLYLVDEDDCIISEFKPGSNSEAIRITNEAVPYMESLGFTVHRPEAWNVGATHYTYTNAIRLNNRIFIPAYGSVYGSGPSEYNDEDNDAIAQFEAAAGPSVEIIPIDCYDIIDAAGAIHCICMQVPRHIDSTPSAHVIWPDGGELLVSEQTYEILWEATDEWNQPLSSVDLYYSLNNGASWTFIANTIDDGAYPWTVPIASTDNALIKIIAHASDTDTGEAVSEKTFQIYEAEQIVYNFSTGAGSNKYCYGYETNTWNGSVAGVRKPVTSEISSTDYDRLAYSDATGGDSDSNRYISPDPAVNWFSTHIFEFTINEDPSEIDDIEILWEGYGQDCTQAELYLWDYTQAQWCDAEGNFGQNRFIDNWAGNKDGLLKGNIRSNFNRYINPSGQLTLLSYSDRASWVYVIFPYYLPLFHDYIKVTVTNITSSPPFILDGECFYEDNSPVNDVDVIITNLNTGESYDAQETDNYYYLELSPNDDVAKDDTLRYFATDTGHYINVTDHVVTQTDLDNGGITKDLILDEYYTDLTDFPFYPTDGTGGYTSEQLTGPACLEMALDYMHWNTSESSTIPRWTNTNIGDHGTIYDNISEKTGGYVNARGLQKYLQAKRPLPYDQFGYNFNIKYTNMPWNNQSQGGTPWTQDTVMGAICIWTDYSTSYALDYDSDTKQTVPDPYGEDDKPLKPGYKPHVPAFIPAFGGYDRWMAVRGLHTDTEPWVFEHPHDAAVNETGSKENNPRQADLIEVLGFWLNDPLTTGIGENTYVTGTEFKTTYFQSLNAPGDAYDGEYVAVVEPPKAFTKEPIPKVETAQWPTPLENTQSISKQNSFNLIKNTQIIESAKKAIQKIVTLDEQLNSLYKQSYPTQPIYVHNQQEKDDNYYLIKYTNTPNSWQPRGNPAKTEVTIVVLLDAETGQLKELSWVPNPVTYLEITPQKAETLLLPYLEQQGYHNINPSTFSYRYLNKGENQFYPDIEAYTPYGTFYISQHGTIVS